MPATSPAALARKNDRQRERKRAIAAKKRAAMAPLQKITARRLMPRMPDMTKRELRAMLTQIVQNTAAL